MLRADREDKPSLNAVRIMGELLAGGLGEAVGMLYVEMIARWPLTCIPMVLGSAGGVYLAGNIGNETGSFLATLAGSIIGVGVLFLCFIAAIDLPALPDPLYLLIFLGSAPISATVGFNLTRRYKKPPAKS